MYTRTLRNCILLMIVSLGSPVSAQISLVKDYQCTAQPNEFIRFNNQLYYYITSNCISSGIYRTDGTAAGTVFVSGDVFDQNPTGRCVAGGHLYFGGIGQLKRINGQTGAVELVKTGFSSIPRNMVEVSGGFVLFTANGTGLWRSDGTAAGTYAIRSDLAFIGQMVSDGTTAYMGPGSGDALYKSDGTAAGTSILREVNLTITGLTIWNGALTARNRNILRS